MKNNNLVSIVTPVYKAERFISETLDSVLSQTYDNWEMILVDDCSPDNSVSIIEKAQKKDRRIKLIRNKKNTGAAGSRNTGTKNAKGRYVTFLDADDLWRKDKLERQVKFMQEGDYAFSYTDYEFANEDGKPNGNRVSVPEKINYEQSLKNPIIWTSTVMIDISKIDRELLMMPNVKRGQDAATWWQILKKIDFAYGLNENMSYYRRTNSSLSANKFKALKRTWYLYRQVEKLNLIKAAWVFCWYVFNAIKKRV